MSYDDTPVSMAIPLIKAALENHLRCHADQDGGCDRADHDDVARALTLLGYPPHEPKDGWEWHPGQVTSCENAQCRRAVRRAAKKAAEGKLNG